MIGTNNVILRREIDDLKKQMRLLEETNRGQGDRLLRMTKANGKLVTEVETNRKDLHRMASLKDGVSTLIEKHTETRNEAKTLRRQLNYATTEKVKLEEEHKRVLQDFGDLMAKAEANLQHNAHLEEQNRNLKDRNAALEGLVEELRTTAHENLRLVLEGKAEIAKSDGALMKVKKEAQALTNLTVELRGWCIGYPLQGGTETANRRTDSEPNVHVQGIVRCKPKCCFRTIHLYPPRSEGIVQHLLRYGNKWGRLDFTWKGNIKSGPK